MLIIEKHLPTVLLESMNKTHNDELEIILKLYDAANKSNLELSFKILNELITHTAKHFASEEVLMQESNFPDLSEHRFAHNKHLLDLQAIQSFYEMTNDIKSLITYIEDSLSPWIMEHIEDMDSIAAEFLNT